MSANVTSLSDTLPSSVTKLDSTGTNWAVFEICFCDAVEVKGFWGHFDGTTKRPVTGTAQSLASEGTTVISATGLTADEFATQWEKDERSAKSLLNQKISDSTLMRIRSKLTVEEHWRAIEKEGSLCAARTLT